MCIDDPFHAGCQPALCHSVAPVSISPRVDLDSHCATAMADERNNEPRSEQRRHRIGFSVLSPVTTRKCEITPWTDSDDECGEHRIIPERALSSSMLYDRVQTTRVSRTQEETRGLGAAVSRDRSDRHKRFLPADQEIRRRFLLQSLTFLIPASTAVRKCCRGKSEKSR